MNLIKPNMVFLLTWNISYCNQRWTDSRRSVGTGQSV